MASTMSNRIIWITGTQGGGMNVVADMLGVLGVSVDRSMPPVRLQEYLDSQAKWREAKQRRAFKAPAGYIMDNVVTSLPVDVILVHRPLEDAINSILDERVKGEPEDYAIAAGIVAHQWAYKRMLLGWVPPVLELDYYEVLINPMDAIIDLSSTLGLNPTREQENAACEIADPELRCV